MRHEHVSELLAPFVLHAVSPEQSEQIERHLLNCPRCQAEFDALQEVTSALGNSVAPLPEGLWNKISDHLPSSHNNARAEIPTEMFHGLDKRFGLRMRRQGGLVNGWMAAATTAGAAAAAAALGVIFVHADESSSRQPSQGASSSWAVVAALEAPGHRVVNLGDSAERRLAQFVVVNGHGYLVSSSLPTLKDDETYQLWGIVGNQPISLGLLGRSPDQSMFTLVGNPSSAVQLGVSVEPTGGSVVPTTPMLASGAA
jgi:anti-sigma-K factor RskA